MARITVTGVIKNIGDIQEFASGFKKREIVIDEEGTKFPNPIKFTLKKDSCSLVDSYKEGDKVTVTASINGREWENKAKGITQWFIDLDAYKIDREGSATTGKTGGKKTKPVPPPAVPTNDIADAGFDDADIPF